MLSNFRKRLFLFLIVFTPLVLFYLYTPKLTHISGKTMGTTYSVKAYTHTLSVHQSLQKKIEESLIAFNRELSTYDPESEISLFNNHRSNAPFPISNNFYTVLSLSKSLYEITEKHWDPSIKPLLDLWGVSEVTPVSFPTAAEINLAKQNIGLSQLALKDHKLIKENPALAIDLSSIAKGYGVDVIAQLLKENGIKSAMIEIGGEVFAFGTHPNKSEWRIGINTPSDNASVEEIIEVISLTDQGMATSGDYRNFKVINGKRYTHIINPVTGYPISHNIVSVTVIAPTCAEADGLATAIMVGGKDLAESIHKKRPDIRIILYIKEVDKQSLKRLDLS